MYRQFLLFTVLLLSSVLTVAQVDVPPLANKRVHDEAGILSQQAISFLEQSLRTFEDSTSNQIAILTINSLDGESIDQYGIRVADAWKLGDKAKDNGVILLIAVSDRKMRIEVGQGLEGPLPDAICNRIIRNEMAPSFRRGDYDGGVIASIDAIRKAIKGEYTGTGPKRQRRSNSPIGFLVILIIVIIAMRGRNNRGGGGWSAGTGFLIGSALGGMGRGGGGGFGGGFSGGGGGFGGGGSSGSW